MNNIWPVKVTIEPGIELFQKSAALEGISEVLKIAGVLDRIKINEANNIEPYLLKAKDGGRGEQLNADIIDKKLWDEIAYLSNKNFYYNVIILRSDMYSDGTRFITGLGTTYRAIISINRFQRLNRQDQVDCIKTVSIHEFGHACGLIPSSRINMVEESLGKHCINPCTMQQGLRVPDDWIKISNDRKDNGTFCRLCENDLKQFFCGS